MSDGTTTKLPRHDTRPVFEKHGSETYPRTFKDHEQGKTVQAELQAKHSLLEGLPKISVYDQKKMFLNVEQFSVEDTLAQVVQKDLAKMVQTVEEEIADTVGAPRPRKVAAYKEAAKRIKNNEQSIKHQISERFAQESIASNLALAGGALTPTVEMNPKVHKKYRQGLKLESLFNPMET